VLNSQKNPAGMIDLMDEAINEVVGGLDIAATTQPNGYAADGPQLLLLSVVALEPSGGVVGLYFKSLLFSVSSEFKTIESHDADLYS